MGKISTSLSIAFEGQGLGDVSIEEDTSVVSTRWAYARVTPYLRPDQYRVRGIGGAVETLGLRSARHRELVKFSASAEAKLKYRPSGQVTIGEHSQAIDAAGLDLDFPVLHTDMERGVLLAPQPVTLYVAVEYRYEYRLLRFDRGIISEASPYAQTPGWGSVPDPIVQAIIFTVIGGQQLAYEIPNPRVREAEVYRVTSNELVVEGNEADGGGVWEMPSGWPETLQYPDSTDAPDPAQKTVLVQERTHEVGRIGADGRLTLHTNTMVGPGNWAKPYEQSEEYRPEFTLRQQRASGFLAPLGDAIDWERQLADVQERYAGIVTE